MLHLKKRKLFFIYSISVSMLFISVITYYNPRIAHAETWEVCTREYTMIDMLSEIFLFEEKVEDEQVKVFESKQQNVIEDELLKMGIPSLVIDNSDDQIVYKISPRN